MNVLITGGAGFIGSALAVELSHRVGYKVTVVDNLLTGYISNLEQGNLSTLKFVNADVNNYEDLALIFKAGNFDFVFHYADVVGVKRTLEQPINVLQDIDGCRNVLLLSKKASVKRVFYASSSEVYGEPVEIPQHELTTPLNSRLPYAIVKNVGEAYLRSFHQEGSLDYTIFRFFNTYGFQQSRDFVISKFLDTAVRNRQITIYGDGSQTRTFLHIDDNVEACIKIMETGAYINDVINVGSEIEISVIDLAKTIVRITNSRSEIVHLPALEEGDMTRRKPDNTRLIDILGRRPMSLEDGLAKVLQDLRVDIDVRN